MAIPLPRVSDYVDLYARQTPDADALVLGLARVSYRLLSQQVNALAKALLAAGVTKGDRVATLQAPCPDFLVAFLATASIGGIWVGLNPRYTLEELRHVVEDSQPRVFLARVEIGARDYRDDLKTLASGSWHPDIAVAYSNQTPPSGFVTFDQFVRRGSDVSEDALQAAKNASGQRDPCVIVYTSGSTGRPKGALLHHEGIAAFALAQNKAWPVSPQRVLNFLPVNHVGCLIDVSVPAIVSGGTIVFMEQFDPGSALSIIAKEGITIWGGVPSIFTLQLALPDFSDYDLSSVQLIVWEGAALAEDSVRRLLQVHSRLATNYGLTETCSAATILYPTDNLEVLSNSVGEAFPEVEIRLVSTTGDVAVEGEPGEVQTRSRYNMLGYWRNPDASRDAFTSDGFLRTGDIAVRRPDGLYKIVGRIKEMFKSGGYNVYPREIEAVIELHPLVEMAAVVAVPDPIWQEVGVAFVLAPLSLSHDELGSWCRGRLANYKVPKRFVNLEAFPLLPIGKIDRKALELRARGSV